MSTLNVIYKIAADISGLQSGIDRAAVATERLQSIADDLRSELTAAFTVGALVAFGREVLDAGDKIQKMADQTSMSTDEVQKLMYIAGQSGSSIESLVGSVQKLQMRLGDENTGAAGAMARLGIETEAFGKLGAYEQMTTLSDAIMGIKDPTEVATVGAALFGKAWGEILPAIKSGMKDTGEQATLMSEQTVKSLDRIGDTMTGAKQTTIAWGGALVLAIEQVGFEVGNILSSFNPEHFGQSTRQILAMQAALNDTSGLAGAMAKIPPAAKDVGDSLKSIALSAAKATEVGKDLTRQGEASIKMHEDAAKAAKKHADEIQHFRDSVASVNFGKFVQDGLPMVGLIADLGEANIATQERFRNLTATVNEFHDGITIAGDEIYSVTIPAFAALPNVAAQATDKIREVTDATKSLGDTIKGGLMDSLEKLPQMLVHAFEGGGGVLGAIKAIGVSLSNAILQPIMVSLSKLQQAGISAGSGVAAALGGATGGGTGAAIAGIASGLGGAALAASAWGTSMAAAGVAGSIALGAATLGIGAAAIGIVMLIKHFNSAEKAVNPVREAFVQAAGGLAQLNEKAHEAGITLDHLLNAKNPEMYKAAMDELSAAFQFQTDAMATLDATVQKYGFTISELGPAWAAQKLNDKAAELLQDYQVLTAGGVDHVAIINKMAPSLQEYVNTALLAGSAIPEAMRPILQGMIDAGLLTDAAGEKMTDLAGLTFTETLDKKFSTLIETINKLTDAISRGLGTAITSIPDRTIHIGYQVDNPPTGVDYAATGGFVTARGIQRFAGGGNVLPFTPMGTDTVPAMLTPGESVLTRGATAMLGRDAIGMLNRGGRLPRGGGQVVSIEAMRAEQRATNERLDQLVRQQASFAQDVARAVRDEVGKVRSGGRR